MKKLVFLTFYSQLIYIYLSNIYIYFEIPNSIFFKNKFEINILQNSTLSSRSI